MTESVSYTGYNIIYCPSHYYITGWPIKYNDINHNSIKKYFEKVQSDLTKAKYPPP